MVKSSRSIGLTMLIVALLAAGCQDQAALPGPLSGLDPSTAQAARPVLSDPCTDVADPARLARQMLDAVNAERAKVGLKPLRLDPTLTQIADFYACRLIDGRFLRHVDPYDNSTVVTRAADFGYAFLKIGENLAAEQRTVREAMAGLMNSPGHRANILDPAFTEIGIAVKLGGPYGIYWVQEFGRPLSDGPLPAAAPTKPHPAIRPAASQAATTRAAAP